MKIFNFDSAEDMKDGAVAKQEQVGPHGRTIETKQVGPHGLTIETLDEDGNIIKETEDQQKARIAQENVAALVESENADDQKFEDDNHGLKFAIRPIKNFAIGRIEFPLEIIAEVNEHIDNVIIPANDSFADGLVGQLKNNEKSAQLDFPLDDEIGKQLETVFNQIGTTYLKQGYDRDSKAEVFQCWTNHAYAGDYNPYHDHGCQTMAGLSGFLWLKVPNCIEVLDDVPTALNGASGAIDGFTHLIWGQSSRRDILQLRGQTEDFIKPNVGTMLVFPNWLKHQVMPFFGDGERRSIAMNWNIRDSDKEIMKHLSAREKENFEKAKAGGPKPLPRY